MWSKDPISSLHLWRSRRPNTIGWRHCFHHVEQSWHNWRKSVDPKCEFYFWTLKSYSPVCLSVTGQHNNLDCCRLIVKFEIMKYEYIVLAILGLKDLFLTKIQMQIRGESMEFWVNTVLEELDRHRPLSVYCLPGCCFWLNIFSEMLLFYQKSFYFFSKNINSA